MVISFAILPKDIGVWAMRAVLALFLALQSNAAAGQMLRSADTFPSDHPTVQSVGSISDALRDRTNGRLYIGDLGAGATSSDSFLVAQVRLGQLDMARVNLNALNGVAPLTVIPTLPFVFGSKAKKRQALDGALGRDLLASLEPAGLVGLAFYDSGTYSFFGRTGFINNVWDLKGKRIRIEKGDTSEAMFRLLGAEPVTVPQSQIYRALKAGIIDVVEGSLSEYLGFNYFQVAPYFTISGHVEPPSVLIMSQQRWRSLSKADRDLLREVAASSVKTQRALMDEYEAQAREKAAATGAKISHDFDRQSFRNAFAPLYPMAVRERHHLNWLNRLAIGEDELPEPQRQ